MEKRSVLVAHTLEHNVSQVVDRAHLERMLLGKKKLRVKLGIDPTGTNIHLGFAVVLWKLKEFQDLGHTAVLVVGDFTARIGDPSDKLEKRPFLTGAQIKKNLKNYLSQVGKILDLKKTEVRYNSEWLSKLDFENIAELAELFTFQQILERRNFSERWEKHQEISFREGLYPLMQGYDSVAVKADVELGGTDQTFNLFAGRKIQEHAKQNPQDILMVSMLPGTDGRKMSKSWGNVINITDSPHEQYGKVMSLRDETIVGYLALATDLSDKEILDIQNGLSKGENPKDAKERLALAIVCRYHGEGAAENAAKRFKALFGNKEIPRDVPVLSVENKNVTLIDLVVLSGVVKSKSEARRLIEQGGISVENVTKKDPNEAFVFKGGEAIKIGKRHFFRIKRI